MRKLLALALALALSLLGGCAHRENPFFPQPETYLEINGQEITEPSWETLRNGLENLDSSEESYVYLELGSPLDSVWYLSAALPLEGYDDGLGYILESCVEADGENFRYLQTRTTDREQLLAWFQDFFTGKAAPDLSAWEDISDWYYDDYDDYSESYGDDEIRAI